MDYQPQRKDDFLKQLNTGDQLNNFLPQLQRRGIEKIPEGEPDAYPGNGKHEKNTSTHARKGRSFKQVKIS